MKIFASEEINKGNIEIIGEVEGLEKELLFRNCDLFVLPTKSENFGIVIAEAFSYGLPVITTKATPWEIIEKNNFGWWIDNNEKSLVRALREALIMKNDNLKIMGLKAHKYAEKNLSWKKIKKDYITQYKKLV